VTWHPGDPACDNLLDTTRTLDYVNGYAPLEPGLMSRAGWALLDDSATLVFGDDGWIGPRTPGGTDWYFFGYGHDYRTCLRDYCHASGSIPLIPRWTLGNWWSRYWAYTQDDLVQLIHDFEAYALPFSVCIVDMDWHLTETNNASTGWTGYTWNRKTVPRPGRLDPFFARQRTQDRAQSPPGGGYSRPRSAVSRHGAAGRDRSGDENARPIRDRKPGVRPRLFRGAAPSL
jgi:hypothetical protein